ncbi:TIGR03545 family protein [Treponema ruminis]|nr:TIGR03545 family protein [Treponema ruminis]
MSKMEKKEKTKKPAKMYPAKKLPGMLKKSYKEQKLDKILKKIYIPEDRQLVQSMFSEKYQKGKKELLRVPRESQYTKAQIKSLKVLVKNIKKNKGRFKAAPFIAVASVLLAILVAVTVFKNPVAKMAIRSSMQGVFGAKCDIGSVNVEIFGMQLTVRNLAQASSSNPMKNIFQFDKLDLDFNLTQLLRAKFNAQNVEITGLAVNTDRKTSGELPAKVKKEKVKKEEVEDSAFYAALKEKSGKTLSDSKDSVTALLAQYDPQALIANIQGNIKTKKAAEEAEAEIQAMIEKWQSKPAEIQSDVENFRTSSEKLAKLDPSSLKTPQEIKDAVENIQKAIETGKKIKSDVDSTVSAAEKDKKKVSSIEKKIEVAIKSDRELIKSQIPDLSLDNAKNVLSGVFDEFAYSMLGKYYPYVKKAVSYANSMKSSDSKEDKAKKEAKKAKKKELKRSGGRNVYWRKDRVPKLLIENLHGSGNGIDLRVTNISNDMDKVGKPLVATGSVSLSSRVHKAGFTVDARSDSSAPLISGTYSSDNFPVKLDMSSFADKPGIPSFSGTTSIDAKFTADSDFSFTAGGEFALNPVSITAKPISPDFADRIYSGALASVDHMTVKADTAYSEAKGISLGISSDAEKIIMESLKSIASKEFDSIKTDAITKVTEELNTYTAGFTSKYGDFNDIVEKLKDSKSISDELNKQLESKKSELTNQLKGAAKAEIDKKKQEAEQKAKEEAVKKAEEALGNSGAGKAAGKAAGNLLKGFKK